VEQKKRPMCGGSSETKAGFWWKLEHIGAIKPGLVVQV